MPATIEILIPVCEASPALARTAASLAVQTDREFSVLFGETVVPVRNEHLDAASKQLESAGIPVKRIRPPFELQPIEHRNWLHSQSHADWLKLLVPGEQLKPNYIARLKERIHECPASQFIRCDFERRNEWGTETVNAPFPQPAIVAGEVPNFFPARTEWLRHSINVSYSRTAWLATGGYSSQLPAYSVLNLNLILALHYGVENIAEPLVLNDHACEQYLNKPRRNRVNLSLELWLICRQARNYCRAAKIPWSEKYLFLRALIASLRRG